jgi:RNA polymerase sigma-70 factor (ECF subfamily)
VASDSGVEVAVAPVDDVLTPSFDEFFAAEYRRVVGLAFVLCGRRALAEELAQDAFVKAYQRWATVSTYDDPGAWVRRVVANLATSTLRRRMREGRALARLALRRPAPDEIALDDPTFWAAVRRLPKRQAQCVALHYLEDRSTAEVAAVLGISEATVRVHLHRARSELADTLDEEAP